MSEPCSRLVPAVAVTFARELRSAGVMVSTSEAIDAARAVDVVGFGDRATLIAALRATLTKDNVSAAVLDRLVDRLLPQTTPERQTASAPSGPAHDTEPGTSRADQDPGNLAKRMLTALRAHDDGAVDALANEAVDKWSGIGDGGRSARHHTARTLRGIGLDALLRQLQLAPAGASELDRGLAAAAATAQLRSLSELVEHVVSQRLSDQPESRSNCDLDAIGDLPILSASGQDLAALRRAVQPLARKLASRLGRRRHRRGSLDMRGTVRSSMGSGGIPMEPRLHRRRRGRPQLLVLCDVSGSVAQFAPFTLALLQALRAEFEQVRSWVFIDGMVEVTELLQTSTGLIDVRAMVGRRGLVSGAGRSDYAAALQTFLTQWRATLSPRTTVLIIGDARSHDGPTATPQLRDLRLLSRRVYWFNPEPEAEWDTQDSRAQQFADHVDAMYPVSTLRQLGLAVEAIA